MIDELTCRSVAKLLSECMEAELPGPEHGRLRLHTTSCDACRLVEQQLDLLRELLRRLGPDGQHPPDQGRMV